MDGCSAWSLFASCASHHQHLCISVCMSKSLTTNSKQVTGHELCTVWANKCLVGSGVHPPPTGGGDHHLATIPPRVGGNHLRGMEGGGVRVDFWYSIFSVFTPPPPRKEEL